VSIAAPLINPYGARVFSQQLVIMQNVRYRQLLDEWAPPSVPFLLLALGVAAAFLLLRYRRVPLPSLVPILAATALSTTAVRFEEYFALVAVPAMLAQLGRLQPRRAVFLGTLVTGSLLVGLLPPMGSAIREGGHAIAQIEAVDLRVQMRSWRNVAALTGLTAFSLLLGWLGRLRSGFQARLLALWRGGRFALTSALVGVLWVGILLFFRPLPGDGVEPGRYPDACLAALPKDSRPFNKLSWGGWLIWRGGVRTYIDGRCWGQPIFFEYGDVRGAGANDVLTERRIDAVILPPLDRLVETLAASDSWEHACSDDVSVVYRLSSAL
jgi:hypothetical protein